MNYLWIVILQIKSVNRLPVYLTLFLESAEIYPKNNTSKSERKKRFASKLKKKIVLWGSAPPNPPGLWDALPPTGGSAPKPLANWISDING